MSQKKKRFGVSQAITQGLSETIHVVENNAAIFRNVILPLSRIELDPDNPRKLAITLEDVRQGIAKEDLHYIRKNEELEKLKELAATIESSGVINPIVVYKRADVYRVVAGERRCLASILAGKQEIDARIFNEKPKGFELKLIQWIENTAREDLTLNERMGNVRDLVREYEHQQGTTTLSATLLKNLMGISLSQATSYVAVLGAPDDIQKAIEQGNIQSLDKAVVLSSVTSSDIRHAALKACIDGCSLKELRKMISQQKTVQRKIQDKTVSSNKRGRAITRINMGFVTNPHVIKTMVHAVLQQPEFSNYTESFSKIEWDQLEQASSAFKKLIEFLELEMMR